jgi:hypothetical protein
MPFDISPLINYELTGDGARREYRLVGADGDEDTDALEQLEAFVPLTLTTFAGVLQRGPGDITVRQEGDEVYRGTVSWRTTFSVDGAIRCTDADKAEELEDGGYLFQFSLTSTTVNIKQSISTVSATPATAPNFRKLIGVDENGNAVGAEVPAAQMSFYVRRQLTAAQFTMAYYLAVSKVIGKQNSVDFLGFEIGELLLESVQTTEAVIGKPIDVTYTFRYAPNQVDIVISPDITVPAKRGWDILWVRYEEKIDPVNKWVGSEAVGAYVERVIEEADFAVLEPA